MKALFSVLFTLTLAQTAFAGFDCRTGGPLGGYFCHYEASKCDQAACDKAAVCLVNAYDNNVLWQGLKNIKVVSSERNEDILEFTVTADGPKGKVTTTVLTQGTIDFNGQGVCSAIGIRD